MREGPGRERWARIAAWSLAVCYGLGAPLAAAAELQRDVLSQRFWARWPSQRDAA